MEDQALSLLKQPSQEHVRRYWSGSSWMMSLQLCKQTATHAFCLLWGCFTTQRIKPKRRHQTEVFTASSSLTAFKPGCCSASGSRTQGPRCAKHTEELKEQTSQHTRRPSTCNCKAASLQPSNLKQLLDSSLYIC